MGITTGLRALLSKDDSSYFAAELMELPSCPFCKEGNLLPLLDANEPFALWVCSAPGCAYAISMDTTGDTYFKGVAATEEKERSGKRWIEYSF
jgi:hypothetical protein